jgi:hypothetical protein
MKVIVFFFASVCALAAFSTVSAHPADGQTPNDIYNYENGPPTSWSHGEMTFIDPEDKPALDSLTQLERYMLAGAKGSNTSTGNELPAWLEAIFLATSKYYAEYGAVPPVLDETALRSIRGFETMPGELLDVYRNPLTGQWPRLDAQSLSPGDVFIFPLDESERNFIAERSPYHYKLWVENIAGDWGNLDQYDNYADAFNQGVQLTGPPFYMRVYGFNGVIWNDFLTLYSK